MQLWGCHIHDTVESNSSVKQRNNVTAVETSYNRNNGLEKGHYIVTLPTDYFKIVYCYHASAIGLGHHRRCKSTNILFVINHKDFVKKRNRKRVRSCLDHFEGSC